jgi:hypothetical protein
MIWNLFYQPLSPLSIQHHHLSIYYILKEIRKKLSFFKRFRPLIAYFLGLFLWDWPYFKGLRPKYSKKDERKKKTCFD